MDYQEAIEYMRKESHKQNINSEGQDAYIIAISAMQELQEQREIINQNKDYSEVQKWMQNIIDDAMVSLDEMKQDGKKNLNTHYSPLLYEGRKRKAKTVIYALIELNAYKQLGTLEEMKLLKATHLSGDTLVQAYYKLKQLSEYEKLGTLEELKELVELSKKERPIEVLGILGGKEYECRNCGNTVSYMDDYCKWCGKAQDWSEEE